MEQLQKQMSGKSVSDLAKAALAAGASPEQIAQLAKERGASPKEMAQIQTQIQQAATARNMPGVPASQLSQLQKQLKGASAAEIAQAAIAQGATPEQVAQLAKSLGVSEAQMQEVELQIQAAASIPGKLPSCKSLEELFKLDFITFVYHRSLN